MKAILIFLFNDLCDLRLFSFVGIDEPAKCGYGVGECDLRKEFGNEWVHPQKLIMRPDFIVDQYNTSQTLERKSDVKLKLEFFHSINKILEDEHELNNLSSYLMFDFDLTKLRPGDDMHVHTALFSRQRIRIIQLIDGENHIEESEQKIKRIIRAVSICIEDKIPVEGVIILPREVKVPSSIVSSDIPVLYKNELTKLFKDFAPASSALRSITSDVKNALKEMLRISFFDQDHPETKEEATYRAAQRLFIQRAEQKITKLSQIDFNLIQLTDAQNSIKKDLLAGNALVWGGYGIGKSVSVVAAAKDCIQQYKRTVKQGPRTDFKMLFLSAQGLLCDVNLKLSPYLLMMEKWTKEVCLDLGYDDDLQIINYANFLDEDINFAMKGTCRSKKDIIFISYLLKLTDIKILKENPVLFNNFDIIILEEIHAVNSNIIEEIVGSFERGMITNKRKSKFWVTSNSEREGLNLPGFVVTPSSRIELDNLRNVPSVVTLAEALDNDVGPERYPLTTFLMPSIKCHINAVYDYEGDDEKRLIKIVQEAEKWRKWLEKSSLLVIDCEASNLFEKLKIATKTETIEMKTYQDEYHIGEPLFLQLSDPIEAVVAGAEWHVLIIHIKLNTMNSIEMTRLISKRIISRATTKVFIFSDRNLNLSPTEDTRLTSKEKTDTKKDADSNVIVQEPVRTEVDTMNFHDNMNFRRTAFVVGSMESSKDQSRDVIIDLVQHIKEVHNRIISSDEQYFHYKGFDFTKMKYLDHSLRNQNDNIYLVHGGRKTFILQLDSNVNDDIKRAQAVLESVLKVRLPAYCGSKLALPCQEENLLCISKLFHLLQPKALPSKALLSNSGFDSVGEEEANQFSRKGNMIGQYLQQITTYKKRYIRSIRL